MAAWIPDRPIGYSAEDYRNMPLSQRIYLILCKSLLLLVTGALYAVLIAAALAVGVILFAITWHIFETFGIFCGLAAAVVSLYAVFNFAAGIGLCSNKSTPSEQESSRPSKKQTGLGLGDILIGAWLWKHLTK
jgi:hypothetical protein